MNNGVKGALCVAKTAGLQAAKARRRGLVGKRQQGHASG